MEEVKECIRELIFETDTLTKVFLISAIVTIFFISVWIGILLNIWSIR